MMKKLRRRTLNQSSDLLLSIGQVKWEYNEKEREGKKSCWWRGWKGGDCRRTARTLQSLKSGLLLRKAELLTQWGRGRLVFTGQAKIHISYIIIHLAGSRMVCVFYNTASTFQRSELNNSSAWYYLLTFRLIWHVRLASNVLQFRCVRFLAWSERFLY